MAMLFVGNPPPKPVACSYTHLSPDTRQLLQRIDQTLPPLVTRMQQADHDNRMPYVEVDSCFRAVVLDQLFIEAAEARMRYDLRQLYYKEMGAPSPQQPQAASLLVLEYASTEAAIAAQHLQDSLRQDLQQRCRGQIMQLEPCVGLDSHRSTRLGSHLLHYTLYSQDPYHRASLRKLAGTLTSQLQETVPSPASSPTGASPKGKRTTRSGRY